MQYRDFGRTGARVSALGFGAMRLPTAGGAADIDEAAAIEMIRYGIDHGINYVDTAYVYHEGQSEVVVGKALQDGYRQKVHVATKLPVWDVKKLADCDRFLNEQLTRLKTEQIDFYLLHSLQKKHWPRVRELGVLDWAKRAKREGRIGALGFSFHDDVETFKQIVDAHDWAFCQIQYNYLCEDVQAGAKGLEYAAAKGLAVVIMEPLFGGTLANPPPAARALWDSAAPKREPVDMALQWLWNKPEVSVVLSGMSTLEQVKQNIASAERSGIGSLSAEDLQLIARVRAAYADLSPVPCTKCGYCLPCPTGVNIPGNFELFNQAALLQGNSAGLAKALYDSMAATERAAACSECGECEEQCPQHIPIREELKKVHDRFK